MTAKLSVLRACRTLLRPGGRLGFFTITVAAGLSKRQHRRAARAGPRAVSARRDTASLLRQAGFVDIAETDVTPEYRLTIQAWFDAAESHRRELERTDAALLEEQQRDRRLMLAAVTEGLLRRSLLLAVRPC